MTRIVSISSVALLASAVMVMLAAVPSLAFVSPTTRRTDGAASSPPLQAAWKDLAPPELPPQTGIQSDGGAGSLFSLPSFDFHLPSLPNLVPNLPSLPVLDFTAIPNIPTIPSITSILTPDGVAVVTPPEALLSMMATTFFETPWHVEAILLFAIGNWLYRFLNAPLDFSKAPFCPGTDTYSPERSDAFYQQRSGMVLRRVLKLGFISGTFTTSLLWDWLVLGKLLSDDDEYTALKRAEPRRAKEALRLCEQLGPTFIKLGQALSIRTDLVPEAYALELRALQDAVPPFPNHLAQKILQEQFGVDDLSTVFAELTDEPVASASVGQVYKGILADDGITEVAVKVQRPGILAEIALDLYILRLLTPLQTRLQNLLNGVETEQEDIDLAIALVDEWGRGFVAETDYRLEAKNTINFEAAMRKRGLDAVCAPIVVPELVRDNVLVTEWVQGTRLDLDASEDVPRLCGVAINAYLTMLLDTGVLHCDPHKGNLLRTTDGRLCILDWGMTLDVPRDLQYALLEFIAHINVEDYDAIPQDFINLGFSPPDVTQERLQNSGITEGLSFAFRQLAAGGGPTKIQERVKEEFKERYGTGLTDDEIQVAARAEMMERMEAQLASEGVDVKGVTNIMEEVSRRNRELFSLPPYVLYLARAFSTLEGIGLSIDDNYSIIQECYPYLASRLFTDRNPRAKKALKAMLGLSNEEDVDEKLQEHQMVASSSNTNTNGSGSGLSVVQSAVASSHNDGKMNGFSPAKLLEMSEGFSSYTATTTNVDGDGRGQLKAATEFTKLFLDPKGSTLQDILVDETAKFGDALTRATLRAALIDNPAAKAAFSALRAPKGILQDNKQLESLLPGPLKSFLVDRPADLPDFMEALVATTQEDERILSSFQELRNTLVGPRRLTTSSNGASSDDSTPRSASQQASQAASTVSDLLSDEETRQALMEQLPGAVALGRRMGAGLLRRAAYRTERTPILSEGARQRGIDANMELANAIEPKQFHEEE